VTLGFPKPGKKQPAPFRTWYDKDGKVRRAICNTRTKRGRDVYDALKEMMFLRQEGICPLCRKRLTRKWAQFDHTIPRGMGGGSRDDRIRVQVNDGVWVDQNQVVHPGCNSIKGSRRNLDFIDVP